MGEVTFGRVAAALLSQSWTFAKTMPRNPHFWTLRKTWDADVQFDDVVRYIREAGYTLRFGRTDYRCLNVNGWRYWTMGAPIDETILINRAENRVRPSPYDRMAQTYDDLYLTPEDEAENRAIGDMLAEYPGPFLDIGCGTGLGARLVPSDDYFGIDASSGMVSVAADKGLAVATIDAAEYWPEPEFKPGTAIALFGAASYLPRHVVERIPEMAPHWFLMFYREGHYPRAYNVAGFEPPESGFPDAIPGDRTTWKNWVIVEGAR